jgi:hypothetical protein
MDNHQLAVIGETGSTGIAPYREPTMPRPRHDNNRSTIAGRLGENFTFIPKESTFRVPATLTVRSRPIQIAHHRTFERCQFALHGLEVIAPLMTRNDQMVREFTAILDNKYKRFNDYLEGEFARTSKILVDNGKPVDVGDFSHPEEFIVQVYTPRTKDYINALQMADDVIANYGRVWFARLCDEVNFRRSVFAIRQRVITLAQEIWDLHQRAIIALRKERQRADAERAKAQDEIRRAELAAQVSKADAILAEVDTPEANAQPDFGEKDLQAEEPHLYAEAQRASASRRPKKSAATKDATEAAEPAAAGDDPQTASA